MEPDTRFTLEYFCRLCASEGIIIHPLFPPGDDDPKDELVRMIDVFTSVQLTRLDDAGAVICDKCLQMLDLFCRFREECLRQDVLIRTKRTLLSEELARQRILLEQQQQQQLQQLQQQKEAELLLRQAQEAAVLLKQPSVPAMEIVKLEDEDDCDSESVQLVIAADDGGEKLPASEAPPPTIEIEDCKQECESGNVSDGIGESVQPDSDGTLATGDDDVEEAIEDSSHRVEPFPPSSDVALFSPTGSVSISVQVNQMTLGGGPNDGTETTVVSGTVVCDGHGTSKPIIPIVAKRTFRRSKPNLNKPPPACDICQESFTTHYDYNQHMDRQHAWDKHSRSSLACDPCQMRFTKSYNLKRHMYEVHGELAPGMTATPCQLCGERFLRGYILERHIAKAHRNKKKLKIIAIK